MTVEILNQTVVRVQTCPSFGPKLYGVCTRCGVMEEISKARSLTWDMDSMCPVCEDEWAEEQPRRDWSQPWLG